ncbi:winged helix-turn-helix domain-containing protein [Marininema halotolerans]|uniref:Helix-turn-helix domain-containing protein n=1 Tax=Marininema halotolerans TaxID=1155944 RepID=A0A1I6U7L5_9BACL|nr:helix-turn-helix domain-containing protein [Marininema halotolerans]SFS97338.1 Helix-turn-helix domain-containing protein [Marininema halotolerans]
MQPLQETYRITSTEQAAALLHPLRGEILAHLTQPASATEVARQIGETPQRVNYHLKTLEKVGLVHRTGSRHVKNLVEGLYQGAARTYLLADTLGLSPKDLQRFEQETSLSHLIQTSERIKEAAMRLMDHTDTDEEIPSATLTTQIRLQDESERRAFLDEYVQLLQHLATKYSAKEGEKGAPYRMVMAVYPEAQDSTE